MRKARGYRNNNPLNIRKGQAWLGLSKTQTDQSFAQFVDMVYGYRAAFIIMAKTYRGRGIRTIADIIRTFAPSTENNTEAYIRYVEKEMKAQFGYIRDTEMPEPTSDSFLYWNGLVTAMTIYENGHYVCEIYHAIQEGWNMAFP